jgi:sugar (pentulose or hexulose) kinase
MQFIGIDLGTTFIKGAVLDLDARAVGHVLRRPFPAPLPDLPPARFEIDPRAVVAATRELIDELAAAAAGCAGVVLSSQMHALVLAGHDGVPLSNIITWRDGRALEAHPAGGTYFDQLARRIAPDERLALGNELRPGLPIAALFWMAERGALPEGAVALALPDFVLAQLCGAAPTTDPTIAAAQGALDLAARDWHYPLLERLGLGKLGWPEVREFRQPAGELKIGARALPCYPGVGDQQCALAGAALAPGELSLNIATGSQVSLLRDELAFGDYQVRPYFDGRWLNTITHIPAGRALALLVALLGELAADQGAELADPWGYIARAVEATPATDLQVDLAFFASAVGDRGAIANIHEGNLTVGHLFRAAFERMAETYALCARRLAPDEDWQRLVFSGGLAQRMPSLRASILGRLGAAHRDCATDEDALAGLLALALVCAGRAPSVAAETNAE